MFSYVYPFYSLGGLFFTDRIYAENPKTPTAIIAVVTLSNAITPCLGLGGGGTRLKGIYSLQGIRFTDSI
jgi:hypothetical protein